MNITPKPIPAHTLPAPSGTDPVYLQSLITVATEQLQRAQGDDGRLPYFVYIESCRRQINNSTTTL